MLLPSYRKLVSSIQGIGLVLGILIYWLGWISLVGTFIDMNVTGRPRENPLMEAIIIFIGLPISLWIGQAIVALILISSSKLRIIDAFWMLARFQYPRHWLITENKAEQGAAANP